MEYENSQHTLESVTEIGWQENIKDRDNVAKTIASKTMRTHSF